VPARSCGAVGVILGLVVLVEHGLVTDRHRHRETQTDRHMGVNITGTLGGAGRAPKTRESRRRRKKTTGLFQKRLINSSKPEVTSKQVVIRRLSCSTVQLKTVHWAHCR